MTERLSNAIRQLTPEKVEQVAHYAESLLRQQSGPRADEFLELGWVGKAADAYPEHASGVEAAHAAADMIRHALERSSAK